MIIRYSLNMNKIMKIIFYLLSFNFLILYSLDWIVWGKFIPQAGSLGLVGYVGIVVVLSVFAFLLEYMPGLLRIRR